MQISLDWISDFVDLSDIDYATIADRLTLATAEVEGVEVLTRHVAGVLVGEIVAAEPLSDGKRTLVTVDCGKQQFQTVCGAPNARVGLKAPFAPPGTTLAEGVRIEASEVAGHKSEGILCSARELGMSRWHEILLECPAGIENGTPLAEFLPEQDILIEIDNKSLTHRPDLWGHYAFARELAAIFERPLAPLPLSDISRFDELPAYPLSVDDLDGCPCYACLEFDVRADRPSPLVVQRRLHALGQRTFNLMVDLTNYCMLELGQPTHAFDADRLEAVRVAPMGREGTFTTLDGQERKMLADDLLIWNEKEPVALAGVMGGLNSEVEPRTERVLLESANFKAARIRRTSVRLDLRTDSAQRFEKGQPPINTTLGIQRILHLVEEAGADPRVTSRLTIVGDPKDEIRTIELAPGRLSAMAGCDLQDEQVVKILTSLGFQAERSAGGGLTVGVPPFRSEKDISIEADIAEEVLRVYGYGKIEPQMPEFPLRPLLFNAGLRIQHKLRRVLAASHRFLEVQSYGWTDDVWLTKLGFVPEKAIALKNPATQQASRLRTTIVPNLLALVGVNRAHRDAFRLFEIGEVYSQADDGGCDERTRLSGISYQQVNQPPLEDHFRQQPDGRVEQQGLRPGDIGVRREPDASIDQHDHYAKQYC